MRTLNLLLLENLHTIFKSASSSFHNQAVFCSWASIGGHNRASAELVFRETQEECSSR